jgi:voltage-gated potassium channel Kch
VDDLEPSPKGPRRQIVEWAIVSSLAVSAFILGCIGLADAYADRMYGWTDIAYGSLQLFVLESGANPPTSPAALEIARVLAPAVAAYAAIRALILLFRDQVALLGLRFRLREHVVVVGLSRKGFTLAKALSAAGERVVVIEQDAGNSSLAGCRERGIPALLGDAKDERLLLKAAVPRARALVVTAGDDGRNIDIAFVAAKLVFGRRVRPLSALVHLDDLELWRLMQPRVLAMRPRLPLRIEFFNVVQESAHVLLHGHPPIHTGGPAHLLVVGPSELAESLVVHAARELSAADGARRPLRITIGGADASGQREALLARYPRLETRCELGSWDMEVDPPTAAGEPLTAAFVCLDEESAGLAAALRLATHPQTRNLPTVLAVEDDSVGAASALHDHAELRQLQPFGLLSRTMTADLLVRGTNEILAEAKHQHYVQCERDRGMTIEDNPSMAAWDELDESLKESNRLFADSVGLKLEAAGCAVVPAPLADPSAPGFAFTEAEVEELAREEHDRWCRDLVRAGWSWGPEKDPKRRMHPKLIPWADLTEEDRDKDREPVRALPEMLARLGFEIRGESMETAERQVRLPQP